MRCIATFLLGDFHEVGTVKCQVQLCNGRLALTPLGFGSVEVYQTSRTTSRDRSPFLAYLLKLCDVFNILIHCKYCKLTKILFVWETLAIWRWMLTGPAGHKEAGACFWATRPVMSVPGARIISNSSGSEHACENEYFYVHFHGCSRYKYPNSFSNRWVEQR